MLYVPRFGPRGGGIVGVSSRVFSLDARQLRFPSLAPRVERGLPWSLPRPFCLSPGFSFPVDPYRTGEFLLAVSVTPRQSLAAVLHTLCQDSFSPRECFVLTRFYGLAIFAVHAHELTVLLHYAHSGLSFNRGGNFRHRVFLFMLMAVKRNGTLSFVRQVRARSISHTSTHIFTAAVSARRGE